MKLTIILLIAGLLQVRAAVYGQKINLSVKDNSLETVLKEIKKQSGYNILYNPTIFQVSKPVTIQINNLPVEKALQKCFEGQLLTYVIERQTIIVKMKTADKRIDESMVPETDNTVRQKGPVTGTVRDSVGILPGVTVMVKGTTIGTKTDQNGKYVIDIPDDNAVLVFSFISYVSQEVPVNGQTTIDVTLKPDTKALTEVVVVGFGTQKRTDMVGSVTSIKSSDLKIPSSNLTTALAGRAAGLIAFQRGGEPGRDNADFFIRGVTTFGYKNNPLILIDGMELSTTDLARLQPDDIASFSILKDATSTAVYGARGANGVILVTTKQGKVGKAQIAVRLENSVSTAVRDIEMADPVTYMIQANEATLTRNPLGTTLYSDEKIANTAAGVNPIIYPANNWKKQIFKDYTMNQRANLNVSGGGEVAKYFISGAINRDNGMLKVDHRNNFNNNIDLTSYSLRSNITVNLTKTTEMIVRLSGNFDDYTGPLDGGAEMYRKVMRSNPVLFPQFYPVDADHAFVKHIMYGNYDQGQYTNPYADMTKGYMNYSRSLMLAQLEAKQDLSAMVKGLNLSAMMNINRTSYFDVRRAYNPYLYTLTGYDPAVNTYNIKNINETTATEYLDYNQDPNNRQLNSVFYAQAMLNYSNQFKKHGFSGLLVYMMQNNINASATDLQQSLPFRNIGVSGRATYNYDSRYYLEYNFGYNGSERFAKKNRFGYFPSAGIAWSIFNEKFFEKFRPVVNNLRLRATYGFIGNDAIGSPADRFFYLSNVNMNAGNRGATFGNGQGGGTYLNGVDITRYANEDITWERSAKANLALELGLFNKLKLTAEVYSEKRKNILMSRASIPVTMGLTADVRSNVGQASGKGMDISMEYQQTINKDFWFQATGNFTYARSKYTVYEEPVYKEAYRSRIGNPIFQEYGYIAERLFVDDAEAANSPKQNFGPYGGGDIKYTDVNRDGQITDADRVPIGNPRLPEIVYGFGFSSGYKSFDFSAFFQGLANESFWIDANSTSPFNNQTQLLKAYADSHWSEDSRNVYALWPRLSPDINNNNNQTSTWFMRDGSFLRLKQVELGYKIPQGFQNKLHLSSCRIYINATNLLSFSKYDLWDAEMGGDGLGYPIQRVFNVGLNVTIR
ncbi:SusC/RagA family TonB-linked outer membrane protein [Mucilaginibacter limnophilus]|uniref:SusC/RagA family TonB-linked outer membrane protein n=1 Tax=Mucilaginibacter limnophilus TaxID=1932778 RepID=A0A3S2UZR3_9SPHI|nr:TonB-dependent receptor [Mucilaginibacter limnophilus]RVT97354.1 SusC/RagA family TonB-linked outer membrane protein [Mucilaginibacter limnophilus]